MSVWVKYWPYHIIAYFIPWASLVGQRKSTVTDMHDNYKTSASASYEFSLSTAMGVF